MQKHRMMLCQPDRSLEAKTCRLAPSAAAGDDGQGNRREGKLQRHQMEFSTLVSFTLSSDI